MIFLSEPKVQVHPPNTLVALISNWTATSSPHTSHVKVSSPSEGHCLQKLWFIWSVVCPERQHHLFICLLEPLNGRWWWRTSSRFPLFRRVPPAISLSSHVRDIRGSVSLTSLCWTNGMTADPSVSLCLSWRPCCWAPDSLLPVVNPFLLARPFRFFPVCFRYLK